MSGLAVPYIKCLQLAVAAFTEAHTVFSEGADIPKDQAKSARAYAFAMVASGLAQVEAAAKRYLELPECAHNEPLKVLADSTFRAQITECATSLASVAVYAPSAKRIAASLQRFVEENNPAEARTLAMIADTVGREVKMSGARAT